MPSLAPRMQDNAPSIPPEMQAYLLENLRDIQIPEAVGWWPLAIGWWILIGVILLLIVVVSVWQYLRWQKNAYRRQALLEAKKLREQFALDANQTTYLEQANQLLKRLMLKLSAAEQRQPVADLSGSRWVDALDQHISGSLSKKSREALTAEVYSAEPNIDVAEFHLDLVRWIQEHQKTPVQSAPTALAGDLSVRAS